MGGELGGAGSDAAACIYRGVLSRSPVGFTILGRQRLAKASVSRGRIESTGASCPRLGGARGFSEQARLEDRRSAFKGVTADQAAYERLANSTSAWQTCRGYCSFVN